MTKEAGTGAVSFAQYLIKKEISERINDTMGTLQVYTGISYKKKGKIYMEDTNNLSARARPHAVLSISCGYLRKNSEVV